MSTPYGDPVAGPRGGSATVVVASDGTLERELTYTPFGKVDQESGADPRDTSIYAGHRKEKATGLVYMQARWMNPDTGTFVSIDPVVPAAGDPQSYNAYAYARNNRTSSVYPVLFAA